MALQDSNNTRPVSFMLATSETQTVPSKKRSESNIRRSSLASSACDRSWLTCRTPLKASSSCCAYCTSRDRNSTFASASCVVFPETSGVSDCRIMSFAIALERIISSWRDFALVTHDATSSFVSSLIWWISDYVANVSKRSSRKAPVQVIHTSRSDLAFPRASIAAGRLSGERGREATFSESGNWPSAANATMALLIWSGAAAASGDAMVAIGSANRELAIPCDWGLLGEVTTRRCRGLVSGLRERRARYIRRRRLASERCDQFSIRRCPMIVL